MKIFLYNKKLRKLLIDDSDSLEVGSVIFSFFVGLALLFFDPANPNSYFVIDSITISPVVLFFTCWSVAFIQFLAWAYDKYVLRRIISMLFVVLWLLFFLLTILDSMSFKSIGIIFIIGLYFNAWIHFQLGLSSLNINSNQ